MFPCLIFGERVREECRQLFTVAGSEVLIQNIRGNIFILRALVFGKQITQIPLANLGENQHRDDKNQ